MMQNLTKEEAVKLFRQMWTDMQKELGDNPSFIDRKLFKFEWCEKNFPNDFIMISCPLCDYAYNRYVENKKEGSTCQFCPIDWPDFVKRGVPDCQGPQMHYLVNPISEILALPEREVPDDNN